MTIDSDSDVARNFDYWDNEALKDPYRIYDELRQQCPVAHSEEHGGFYIASRYEEVTAVAKDFATFISGQGVSVPSFPSQYSLLPVESDNPLHAEYRRVLYERLRPQEMAELEPTVRALTTELIDEFIESGNCELHSDLAAPLVAMTIGSFIGLGREHWAQLASWAYHMLYDPETRETATDAFFAFLRGQFENRAEQPGDDMLSELLRAQIQDDGELRTLNEFERMSIAWAIVQASIDTTAGLTTTTLWYLHEHPEIRQRLVDDPGLIESNIEEFIRLFTCVTVSRTVSTPTTLGGESLREGDKVVILLGSANRDERAFDRPDDFVFGRRPNRHVGFGQGIHKCLGMHMAKMEFRVMLEEVLRRMPDYVVTQRELNTAAGAAWRIMQLPLAFAPGHRGL